MGTHYYTQLSYVGAEDQTQALGIEQQVLQSLSHVPSPEVTELCPQPRSCLARPPAQKSSSRAPSPEVI